MGAQLQDRFSFHDSTVTKVERAPDRLTLFLEDDQLLYFTVFAKDLRMYEE